MNSKLTKMLKELKEEVNFGTLEQLKFAPLLSRTKNLPKALQVHSHNYYFSVNNVWHKLDMVLGGHFDEVEKLRIVGRPVSNLSFESTWRVGDVDPCWVVGKEPLEDVLHGMETEIRTQVKVIVYATHNGTIIETGNLSRVSFDKTIRIGSDHDVRVVNVENHLQSKAMLVTVSVSKNTAIDMLHESGYDQVFHFAWKSDSKEPISRLCQGIPNSMYKELNIHEYKNWLGQYSEALRSIFISMKVAEAHSVLNQVSAERAKSEEERYAIPQMNPYIETDVEMVLCNGQGVKAKAVFDGSRNDFYYVSAHGEENLGRQAACLSDVLGFKLVGENESK